MSDITAGGNIKILIVDDQPMFAEGLKTILESRASDMDVRGIAHDGQEAIKLALSLQPDIILMDVRMPVMDGVKATKEIHGLFPAMRIVVLTTFDDDEYVKLSLEYGAIGYLLKNRPPAEIIASIRAVMGGVLQIDPAVSKSLIKHDQEREFNDDEFLRSLNSLTRRERDILGLLSLAYNNKQIAAKLNIGQQTVRNYISAIYSKLGIMDRVEVLKYMDKIQFYLDHF